MRSFVAAVLALSVLAVAPAAAQAADPPPGSKWTQETIQNGDVELHADVLRPANLPANAKTPVILSIGPYFNHSGQVGPAGPVQEATYDPIGPSSGPSDRFYDFVEGAKLMQRGYTFVMVDLRGFGGSTGCLDWGGPGEQSDVVAAVNWAASQPWSTGKVGMYGKSYDGVTGLIGANKRPKGLAAVVAQEPVYDLYRYLYGDGMRRLNSAATPALYNLIALTPGPLMDAPLYNVAAAQSNGCLVQNQLDQTADDNHESEYWKQRTLIPGAKGSDVPLFLTQGLTENNTVADGMAQYLENHTGYEQGWLGPWDHVRGNERDEDGRLKMGRAGWFDETMRFYDRFLKGVKPRVQDPKWAIQTNDGKWFAEDSWKPASARAFTSTLRSGTYADDAGGNATGSGADEGLWTISKPLANEAHLAGSGRVTLDVTKSLPTAANLVVDVYDLDAQGTGPLITRQGHLVRGDGTLTLDLWSADWKIAKGHRIGVRITDANDDWWIHTGPPLGQTVTVKGGSIALPFQTVARKRAIQGDPGVQLEEYLSETVTVPSETISSSESPGFALPGPQKGR